MRYAYFDNAGRVDSAFNDDTVAELPDGAVELDESQFANRFDLELVDGTVVVNPLPIAPSVTLIRPITPWQIRKALNADGLRAAAEAAVAAADQDTKDAWEFASQFDRYNPMVVAMGEALGKTPADIDSLFIKAASM